MHANSLHFPIFYWGTIFSLLKSGYRNLSEEQKIYNHRLARARRVIKSALGILAAGWRIFHRPLRATVEHVELFVLAALALHNYFRLTSNAMYNPSGFFNSESGDGSIHLGEWHYLFIYSHCLKSIKQCIV